MRGYIITEAKRPRRDCGTPEPRLKKPQPYCGGFMDNNIKQGLCQELRGLLEVWGCYPTARTITYQDYANLAERIHNVCDALDRIERLENVHVF